MARVTPVIQAVLDFVHKKANPLPSEKSIRNMNIERLIISQKQVGEVLSTKENTTLQSDETSKFGEVIMTYNFSDAEKRQYVGGVREIPTKSSQDTFDGFKEMLRDIEDRSKSENCSSVGHIILAHIKNTMSDRAKTEVKWHDMLEEYRTSILPLVYKHWDKLNEDEQQAMARMRHLAVHKLINTDQI